MSEEHCLGALVGANALDVVGPAEVVLKQTLDHVRADLYAWYRAEEVVGRQHTKVQHLSLGMVGLKTNRS